MPLFASDCNDPCQSINATFVPRKWGLAHCGQQLRQLFRQGKCCRRSYHILFAFVADTFSLVWWRRDHFPTQIYDPLAQRTIILAKRILVKKRRNLNCIVSSSFRKQDLVFGILSTFGHHATP